LSVGSTVSPKPVSGVDYAQTAVRIPTATAVVLNLVSRSPKWRLGSCFLEVQSAARSLDHWYVDSFSISWCSTVLTPSTKYSPGCSRAVVHSHSVLLQRADDGGFSTNEPTNSSSSSSSSSSRVLGVVFTRQSQRALLLALAQYEAHNLLVMKMH